MRQRVDVVLDCKKNTDAISEYDIQCTYPQAESVSQFLNQECARIEPRTSLESLLTLEGRDKCNAILRVRDMIRSGFREYSPAYNRYLMSIFIHLLENEKDIWSGAKHQDLWMTMIELMWLTFECFLVEDPRVSCDFFILCQIQQFLLRIVREYPDNLDLFVEQISRRVNLTEFYNFFVFFLHVLDFMPAEGLRSLCKFQLLPKLFDLAVKDLCVFDFVQKILQSPEYQAYQNELVRENFVVFALNCYFDETRRETLLLILSYIVTHNQEDPNPLELRIVINAIIAILKTASIRKDESGFLVLPVMCAGFVLVPDDVMKSSFIDGQILNSLAALLRECPIEFDSVISRLTELSSAKAILDELLDEHGHEFFEAVMAIDTKKVAVDLEQYKAFVCAFSRDEHHMARLLKIPTALLSCLFLSQSSQESEQSMIRWMSDLAQNSANAYEMYQADISLKIIERIRVNQENYVLYLDLLRAICEKMCCCNVFHHMMRLIGDVEFHYPEAALETLRGLIRLKRDASEPTSFFKFRKWIGCGIHVECPTMPSDFSLVTSLRIFRHVINQFYTLFSCCFDRGYSYVVGFSNGKLVLRILSQDRILVEGKSDDFEVELGKWFSVTVIFWNTVFHRQGTILVDGKQILTVKCAKQINTFIGASVLHFMSSDTEKRSLHADMTAAYIIRDTDVKLVSKFVALDQELKAENKSVIYQFNPSLVQGKTICHVGNDISMVQFIGSVTPYMQTINDLLPYIDVVKNILPVLTRVSRSCDTCKTAEKANEKWYCSNCGAMSLPAGRRLLQSFYATLADLVTEDERLFDGAPYFVILSELIGAIQSDYVSEPCVICQIVSLVGKFHSEELRREYLMSCFNFDIIRNWTNEKSVEIYVRSVLPLGMRSYPKAYNIPISKMLMPFLDYESGNLRSKIDGFFMDFFQHHGCQEDLDWLLIHAESSSIDLHVTSCLLYLETFAKYHPEMLKEYGYYEPFLCFMNKQFNVQAFRCVDALLSHSLEIDISKLCYQMIHWLSIEINTTDIEKFIHGWFFNEPKRQGIKNCQFLPLFSHFYSVYQDGKGDLLESLTEFFRAQDPTDIFEVPGWHHWLYVLVDINGVPNFDRFIAFLSSFLSKVELQETTKFQRAEVCRYLDLVASQTGHNIFEVEFFSSFLSCVLSGSIGSDVLQVLLDKVMFSHSYELQSESIPVIALSNANNFLTLNRKVSVSGALNDRNTSFTRVICNFLISQLSDVTIAGRTVKCQVLAAFLIAKILWRSNELLNDVQALCSRIIQSPPEVRYECYFWLNQALTEHGASSDVRETIESSLQNLKEASISMSDEMFDVNEHIERYQRQFDNFQTTFCEHFEKVLGDTANKDSFLAKKSHKLFIKKLEELAKKQTEDVGLIRMMNRRTLDVFMREISCESGAWTKSLKNRKFKLCNRISRTGMRTLMVINHNFSLHPEAVEKRDSPGILGPRRKPELEHLKKQQKLDGSNCLFIASKVTSISVKRNNRVGYLSVVPTEIQFRSKDKAISMKFAMISFIVDRRLCNVENSIEVFMRTGASYFFTFHEEKDRGNFYFTLAKLKLRKTEELLPGKFSFFGELQRICNGLHQNHPSEWLVKELQLARRWRKRQITTYEYVYYLNVLSGRSFRHSYQYPIYPWLISDNESEKIDLDNSQIYRDLTQLPLALSPSRLERCRESYAIQGRNADSYLCSEIISSFVAVYHMMVRVEPFTTLHIAFQGSFECTDRLYHSVAQIFQFIYGELMHAREAIPECFSLPQTYINENGFDLGATSGGKVLNDLELPPWAASPYHFTSVLRRGLETNYVGSVFGHWIDLVYGKYRRSFEHNNIFPRWAYPELGVYNDDQTLLCGCVPAQIFTDEHPARNEIDLSGLTCNVDAIRQALDAEPNAKIVAAYKDFIFCTGKVLSLRDCQWRDLQVTNFDVWAASRSLKLAVLGSRNSNCITTLDLETDVTSTLKQRGCLITCACIAGGEYLVTGSTSSAIHVYKLPSLTLESIGRHQPDSIIAVAANADLGLIVSISRQYMMVIETLLDNRLINSVQIVSGGGHTKIAIFKSGIIVVAQRRYIAFFDVRGVEIRRIEFTEKIPRNMAIAKYYDYDTRELLIATSGENKVSLFDVGNGEVLRDFETSALSICPVKQGRAFLAIGETTSDVKVFDFSERLTSEISPGTIPDPSKMVELRSVPPGERGRLVVPIRCSSDGLVRASSQVSDEP